MCTAGKLKLRCPPQFNALVKCEVTSRTSAMIRAAPVCVMIYSDAKTTGIRALNDTRTRLHALTAPKTHRAVFGYHRHSETMLNIADRTFAMRALVLPPLAVTVLAATIITASTLPNRLLSREITIAYRTLDVRPTRWSP